MRLSCAGNYCTCGSAYCVIDIEVCEYRLVSCLNVDLNVGSARGYLEVCVCKLYPLALGSRCQSDLIVMGLVVGVCVL